MKKCLWYVILLCPIFVFSQEIVEDINDEQKNKITDVVKIWMDNLLAAKNQRTLLEISDLPFALDRKKVLLSNQDLELMYQKIFEVRKEKQTKNSRYEIVKLEYINEIYKNCIPLSFAKVGVIIIDGENREGIIISVSVSENGYKISGFSD